MGESDTPEYGDRIPTHEDIAVLTRFLDLYTNNPIPDDARARSALRVFWVYCHQFRDTQSYEVGDG